MEWLLLLLVFGIAGYVILRPRPDTWAPDLLERWPTIAEHAGLKGAQLHDPARNEWGWTGTVLLLPGSTAADANTRVDALDSALDVRPHASRFEANLGRARETTLRVLERDPLAEVTTWPGPTLASILHPMLLGPDETGQPVRVTLAYQCVLIAGETGSGKSGLVNAVIGELVGAEDAEVWGIDFKGGLELEPWRPVLKHLATTPAEARELLTEAVETIAKRQAQLRGRARLWKPSPAEPAIVVVVDEQAEMAAADKKLGLVDAEETIARTGRALAVTGIFALQRALQAELGSDVIRQQSRVRISCRVEEAKEADLVFGAGAAAAGWRPDRLGREGSFLIRAQHQGLVVPRPARALWVSDEMVERTVRERGGK